MNDSYNTNTNTKARNMKDAITPIVLILIITCGFALIGQMDSEDERRYQQLREEMEQTWCRDAVQGLAPEDRAGWPPEDGKCSSGDSK